MLETLRQGPVFTACGFLSFDVRAPYGKKVRKKQEVFSPPRD